MAILMTNGCSKQISTNAQHGFGKTLYAMLGRTQQTRTKQIYGQHKPF